MDFAVGHFNVLSRGNVFFFTEKIGSWYTRSFSLNDSKMGIYEIIFRVTIYQQIMNTLVLTYSSLVVTFATASNNAIPTRVQ